MISETFETACTWDRFDALTTSHHRGARHRRGRGRVAGGHHLPVHARVSRRSGAVLHRARGRARRRATRAMGRDQGRGRRRHHPIGRNDHAPSRRRPRPPALATTASGPSRSPTRSRAAKRAIDPAGNPQSRRAHRPVSVADRPGGVAGDGVWAPGRRALTTGLVFTITLVGFEGSRSPTILQGHQRRSPRHRPARVGVQRVLPRQLVRRRCRRT